MHDEEDRMGIHGLSRVIADCAPGAIKEGAIGNYFGRKVAIDASMSIYQFLIAVRNEGNVLTNEAGETTSHLIGMFYRTIRIIEAGIRPIFVFDGKPPTLKSGELAKRLDKRAASEAAAADAREVGDGELVDKFAKRTVKATRQHTEDCKRLLKLMGVPIVQAPCEAEAQCAKLVAAGMAYASGSEDMDTITFGSAILLRHLTFSEARKMPIVEISLEVLLRDMNLTMDAFIDLCILLGCDYCDTIKGMGPKGALAMIRAHGSIEAILAEVATSEKYVVPDGWAYKEARELFRHPHVLPPDDPQLSTAAEGAVAADDGNGSGIRWEAPDEEGIVEFLVKGNGFNEKRIRAGVEKLIKARGKSTQGRLDSFFKALPKAAPAAAKAGTIRGKENGSQSGGAAAKRAKAALSGRGAPKK